MGTVGHLRYSPHQSGVAIDLYLGYKNNSENVDKIKQTEAYQWLRAFGPQFGFNEYEAEGWHWDYNAVSGDHYQGGNEITGNEKKIGE